jgi:hypothetical protein
MGRKKDEPDFGRFDVNAIANGFPDTAETLLLDSVLRPGFETPGWAYSGGQL